LRSSSIVKRAIPLEILLEFYNAEFNPQINAEVQLIEKWSKLINDAIHPSVKIKKVV